MALDFTRLENEVREMGTVVESVVSALKTVAEAMRREADDQTKIRALADQLDAQAGTLASAMTVNTPAANEPAPTTPSDAVAPVEDAIVQ